MKSLFFVIPLATILLISTVVMPTYAQFQSGGVDKDGEWYAGEGLKQGDYFSYRMCHVDYKECASFTMNIWFKGDVKIETEEQWVAEVVVYDGSKIIVGEMNLGKLAPEPTGSSIELDTYASAFKSSIVWLSAFATEYGDSGGEGPKAFRDISWGKIANIGGEQILPTAIENVTVPAGTWETVVITWKTGGYVSKVWLVDDFPFPIKAATLTHVSEGIPPPEYQFELLDYKENVQQSPFEGIASTKNEQIAKGCPQSFEKVSIKKPSKNFQYQVHVIYGPEYPIQGCEMEWLIKFISKYDDTEFLNQVQYDLLVVDENQVPIRSIAHDEGRQFLYSPSGQSIIDMTVNEELGTAKYVIWIYGLAPENRVPATMDDYVEITIPISEHRTDDLTGTGQSIPSWVKNNAGWWADGQIDDNSFVQGIQYLIKEGIMKIPPTAPSTGTGNNQIPSWVKNNAGWWADGQIDDNSFVQGIQYLIKEGIVRIPTQTESETSEAPPLWLD